MATTAWPTSLSVTAGKPGKGVGLAAYKKYAHEILGTRCLKRCHVEETLMFLCTIHATLGYGLPVRFMGDGGNFTLWCTLVSVYLA